MFKRLTFIFVLLLMVAVFPKITIAKDTRERISVINHDKVTDIIIPGRPGPILRQARNPVTISFACTVPMRNHFRIFFGYSSKVHQLADIRLDDYTPLLPYQNVLPRYRNSRTTRTGEFYITLAAKGYAKVVEIYLTNDAGVMTVFKFHTADFKPCF
jgi:hypothetical protein